MTGIITPVLPPGLDSGRIVIARNHRGLTLDVAEEIKRFFRSRHVLVVPKCVEEARERAQAFWEKYEQINRDMLPDDPVFSIINEGTALSTTADNLTFQAPASGQIRVLELIIGGEATTSAVNRVAVQRAGTSITSNTAITPEKFNNLSPAAAGTYGKAGTQALVGNALMSFGLNAFGGFVDWKAAPGEEIYGSSSAVISQRSKSGTSTVTSTGIFEEL